MNRPGFPITTSGMTAIAYAWSLIFSWALLRYKVKESHVARSFDGLAQRTLVVSAGAAAPPRDDLAPLGYEFAQLAVLLVIDVVDLINAKRANFPPRLFELARRTSLRWWWHICSFRNGS